ncbi:MAG: hypothetical protein P4L68_08255 [Methylovirgula sp.]|nr:hypothetical protein [Methylovirgula sp.]
MTAGQSIVANGITKPDDELTLLVDGQVIGGFEDVKVSLRAEGFPNSFTVKASMQPGDQLPMQPGDDCVVKLGNDTVITGWVDRLADAGDEEDHLITISGRGLTEDLVDCGAEWPSHQLIGGNALTIAQRLAQPYNLEVVMGNGASPGADISQWALNYGETGAEIIQRVARNAGLLAYEDNMGRLVLANVGAATAASGIVYGQNVQAWSVERTMDQRFSDYVCCMFASDSFGDLAGSDFYHSETDPNVPRHRLTYLVVDAVATNPQDFTIQRAKWEAARRAGRAFVVNATVDSWRDSAGGLWLPNTLVPVDVPGATGGNMLVISEVNFIRNDGRGTIAEVIAMPKAAFQPEPIVLAPVNTADIVPAGAAK